MYKLKLKPRIHADSDVWRAAGQVCNILYESGHECYAVGGAVRDLVLGKEPSDIDLATDALPGEVKKIFSKAGCKVYPTGEKYGTVTVTCDNEHYFEVTTFRGEKYTRDSRKPIVTFSKSLKDDMRRRDFTINALAYDFRTSEIIDFFGGLEDLRKGIIRAVGTPERRFREDPLRIFRMCRFAATYNFTISPETFEAAKKMSSHLDKISIERMVQETRKAFIKSNKPSIYISCLVDTGAMKHMIPEIYDTIDQEQPPPHMETVYEHTMLALDFTPNDFALRMAALLHDIAKPHTYRPGKKPAFPGHAERGAEMADKILRRLRLSNRERETIVKLVRHHDILLSDHVSNDREARRTLLKLSRAGLTREEIEMLMRLVESDTKATLGLSEEKIVKTWEKLALLRRWLYSTPLDRRELAITGDDLVKIGVKPRAIGRILEKLLDYVAEDPSRNTKGTLRKRAKILAKSMGVLS